MPMDENLTRVRGMLGLAMRAGRVIIGTEQVCVALKKGKIRLALVARDASQSTKKKIAVKCEFYGVTSVEIQLGAEELGALLGKTYTPAVVGITDEGFARELLLASKSE